ncbi:MAG: preprotein translocase subunit SecA [Actinobacteria bacterium]|nr:preprotein translocase subunit SecA [Actinomycetota bacterium]MCB9427364.1 preprotein translocase subunit SecA [Actinomycetota bacterium]HPE11292.1 preprotein translocase subunit SecA [Actinomycetota bacterium]HPQ83886.1 preprotein translocase subunit SecA [Actinomycetota bacterium]HRV65898.1 preprotein translocase subunit SecA [Candidatus Nanopelagicales bacterium]
MRVLDKILRAGEGKVLRKLKALSVQVNALEADFRAMSDEELRDLTPEFRARLEKGETLDDLLPEAFAAVREAATRTLGQRHYDVQVMGGAALHLGNIAEMKTGEGKTLVSTLPAYLNALSGKGVHIITVNDYLAERDSAWMGRVHRFLGLEVGCILSQMSPEQRRTAYAADITYGTNNEFGFDYLRDNMAWNVDEMVQRGHNFAIVDEVDSILIDEARTPLIISGPADQSPKWYADFAKLVKRLHKDEDYEVDIKKRTVGILDPGVVKVEDWLGVENLYETVNTPLVGFLNNAIRAKELFERDKEYVVQNGEVLIVDEHTGRILAGRRYNEGLHQAIEAKENVEIKAENQTLATITLQNYFRMYDKLSGMTGTAMTEAAEFNQIYKLGVVPIPTNQPNIRVDLPDTIYRTEGAKFAAVVEDIQECQEKGQPVLVGTASVEKSEVLSALLKKSGVRHEVLNAKHHEREASIVGEAGRRGAVTVATNMAGRGTDIMLGGNPEMRAAADLEARGLDPVESPEDYEAAWPDALSKAEESVKAEHEEVTSLGGLYVLATERHESRRIDNQLRGRSARQGDPGTTRFYLSLEDDLMKRFNATMVDAFLTRFNVPDDVPIEAKMVSRAIASAQGQVEAQNFEIRKNVLKYDEVLNRQRQVIYAERHRVLNGEDLEDEVRIFLDDTIAGAVANATAEGYPEEWDLDQLWTQLQTLYPVGVSVAALEAEAGGDRSGLSADLLTQALQDDAQAAYDRRVEELGEPVIRELERQVILNVLDRKWREHLYEMDYLQEGIGLRAMAQRDPLVEYQKEGYDLFAAMMNGIKEETVGYMFHVQPTVEGEDEQDDEIEELGATEAPQLVAPGLVHERPQQVQYSAPTLDEEVPAHVERGTLAGGSARDTDPKYANVARNAQCPCGSGKKFKRCHGDPKNAA